MIDVRMLAAMTKSRSTATNACTPLLNKTVTATTLQRAGPPFLSEATPSFARSLAAMIGLHVR